MSGCRQANWVLAAVNLRDSFDFIATGDDVENGKPDPEIYTLVASELAVDHEDCLVIEDSVSGVEAAIAAGMQVLAVSTPFTKRGLHESNLLLRSFIIDDPDQVAKIASSIMR